MRLTHNIPPRGNEAGARDSFRFNARCFKRGTIPWRGERQIGVKRTEVRASITAVLALLFVATTPAASATTTWDGSSSGFSNTAANWAEHAVPGNKVRLSWPTRAAGYQLESRPTLSPTSWSGVMNESLVNGGNFNVTSNPAGTNQFYRLRKSLP